MTVALLIVGLTAAAACERNESSPDPTVTGASPASLPSSSPLDPVEAAEEAAQEAYRGMWDAYLAALSVPDPQHPDLARFTAEDALRVLVEGVEAAQREGLAGRGEVTLDPVVEELTPADAPTSAEIVDCADDSGAELYRVDGEPYEDSPGGLRRAEATVRQVSGMWKVVGFALYEVGTCGDE